MLRSKLFNCVLLTLLLPVCRAENDTLADRDDPGPDIGVAIGVAKGIANGDFLRNLLESIGIRQRTANGTLPDIVWPKQGTEVINILEKNLSILLSQLQQMMRHAVNRNRDRNPRLRRKQGRKVHEVNENR